MATKPDTKDKLRRFKAILKGKARMLIVLQDRPDPDALAAAVAMRQLVRCNGVTHCSIACGDAIGRAENRAMAEYLQLHPRRIEEIDLGRFELIAMLDTQPGTGNNALPAGVTPDIVIDHHPFRKETRRASFWDVRRAYGATSTILFEYLKQARITPERPVATALLYGIRSDTQDFERDATQADIAAYGELYARANKRMLGQIQRGRVPSAYYQMLVDALANASLSGRSIYSGLGSVESPDMIAEVADLLLRHEKAEWSLCWGYRGNRALLSIRTISIVRQAGDVIRSIVAGEGSGGGHRSMAGGEIPCGSGGSKARARLDRLIRTRFLEATEAQMGSVRRLLGA